MIEDTNDENIFYDNLSFHEIYLLRRRCFETIRRKPEPSSLERFIESCFTICTCSSDVVSDFEITETFLEVSEILIKNSKVEKMFLYEADEEEVKVICKNIYTDYDRNIHDIDIKVLASSYIYYIKNWIDKIIPNDVMMLLILSYKNNDSVRKKECIERMPFIILECHREFFILLFKLMRSIDENKKYSNTTFDELLELFGPITIKNPSEEFEISGLIQKQILKDLSDIDFGIFPKSFYNLEEE